MDSQSSANSRQYRAILPGPDRKRTEHAYEFRLAYRNPNPEQAGCIALWEIGGGRMLYQIALERDIAGRYSWHCTCADAVYRAADQGRVCKHVQGLLATDTRLPQPQFRKRSA